MSTQKISSKTADLAHKEIGVKRLYLYLTHTINRFKSETFTHIRRFDGFIKFSTDSLVRIEGKMKSHNSYVRF